MVAVADHKKCRPEPGRSGAAENAITSIESTVSAEDLAERDAAASLVCCDPEQRAAALAVVQADDFTEGLLPRYVVDLVVRMVAAGEHVDRVTVPGYAERHDGVRPFSRHLGSELAGWIADLPLPLAPIEYARPVVERAARRRLTEASSTLAIAAAEQPIVALRSLMAGEFRTVADLLDRAEAVGR